MLEPLGLTPENIKNEDFSFKICDHPLVLEFCAQAHAILTAADQLQTTLAQTRTAPRPNWANLFEADFVECLFHRLA